MSPIVIGVSFIVAVLLLCYFSRVASLNEQTCYLDGLSTDQLKLLKKHKITFKEEFLRERHVVVVSRLDWKKAVTILGGETVGLCPAGKKKWEAIFTYRQPNFESLKAKQVTFQGLFPLSRRRILPVLANTILPVCNCDIVVHGMGAQAPVPADDGKFHIFLFGNSRAAGEFDRQGHLLAGADYTLVTRPDSIWGVDYPNHFREQKQAFAPDPTALSCIDTAAAFCPVQIKGNCMFILFDVLGFDLPGLSSARKFWRRIKLWGWDFHIGLLARTLSRGAAELAQYKELESFVDEQSAAAESRSFDNAAEPKVKVSGFATVGIQSGRPYRLGDLALKMLAGSLPTVCTIVHAHGETVSAASATEFTIYFNGAARGAIKLPQPATCWGLTLPCKAENINAISADGVPIYDDNGNAVGELVGKALFVFPELMKYGTAAECMLWARFLIAAREVILSATRQQDEHLAQAWAKCVEGELKKLKARGGRSDAAASLKNLTGKLKLAVRVQREMLKIEQAPYEDLGAEFDSILSISKVTDVAVSAESVVVQTTDLFCVDPRSRMTHWIGPFEITISAKNISWRNKAAHARKLGMNAPHVDANGKACMGNMGEVFTTLLSERQFAACVEAAIAFVEAVNVDDSWGKKICNWPIARIDAHGRPIA